MLVREGIKLGRRRGRLSWREREFCEVGAGLLGWEFGVRGAGSGIGRIAFFWGMGMASLRMGRIHKV